MVIPGWIADILELLALAVDFVGYAILAFTAVKFTVRYVAFEAKRLRGWECAKHFRDIRMELLSHVVLAVDFMVISDVIHTALVQSRDGLITLGLFVLIRSVLAFFLGQDLKEVQGQKAELDAIPQ